MTRPIHICAPVRSPIGKFGGGLASLMPAALSEPIAKAAIERAGARGEIIDETIWGHGRQAGGGPNTARQVATGRWCEPLKEPRTAQVREQPARGRVPDGDTRRYHSFQLWR